MATLDPCPSDNDDDFEYDDSDGDDTLTFAVPPPKPKAFEDTAAFSEAEAAFMGIHAAESINRSVVRMLLKQLHEAQTDPDLVKAGITTEARKDCLMAWDVAIPVAAFDKDDHPEFHAECAAAGVAALEFAVTFPAGYNGSPPFVRLVTPRLANRSGHVTAGGSICTHLLADGWLPSYTMAAVILQLHALIGVGKPRLPPGTTKAQSYSEAEARAAFVRVARDHGWSVK